MHCGERAARRECRPLISRRLARAARRYSQEVPYACECRVDAFKESDDLIKIRSQIFVSHESQKGIVIGKGGGALKKVGTRARKRMEDFFQKKIYLETRVKVRPNWRQDEKSLDEFGYLG